MEGIAWNGNILLKMTFDTYNLSFDKWVHDHHPLSGWKESIDVGAVVKIVAIVVAITLVTLNNNSGLLKGFNVATFVYELILGASKEAASRWLSLKIVLSAYVLSKTQKSIIGHDIIRHTVSSSLHTIQGIAHTLTQCLQVENEKHEGWSQHLSAAVRLPENPGTKRKC